jgi:Mor family transcriptional regulator
MSTETRIAVLEADTRKMEGFFSRLDTSIEKIAELNVSIREVLSSHETRINATEIELETQFSMFDQRYEQLHSRITTVHRELSEEMKEETKSLMDSIADLKDAMLDQQRIEEERLRNVEKRQWMIMGAAAVLGFIAGNASLMNLLG